MTRGADLRLPLPTKLGCRAAASRNVAIAGSVGGRQNSRKRVNPRLAHTAYVMRVIHLAFLAPDIVQAIVRGEQPMELTVDRLMRLGPLPVPVAWEHQRMLLGMGGGIAG